MEMTGLHGFNYNIFLFDTAGVKRGYMQKLLMYLSPVIYIFLVLYSLVYIIWRFVTSIISLKYTNVKITGNVCLLYMDLTMQRIKSAGLDKSIDIWIAGPNLSKTDTSHLQNLYYCKDIASFADIFATLGLCLRSFWFYLIHFRCLSLFYKSWDFYITYVVLKRYALDMDVCFSNQSDNWAIMFDNLPFRSRTLVQHGYIGDINLPVVLNNINVFYSLSQQLADEALSCLFSNKPRVVIMPPSIKLTDYHLKGFKILLVLDIRLLKIESLIVRLLSGLDVVLFLKRHPSLTNDICYRELVSKYKVVYITEQVFPKVDYVISYNSTLAYEYMNYNIPVYVYTKDNTEYNVDDVEYTIRNDVKKYRT